jgi:hypothetical protein
MMKIGPVIKTLIWSMFAVNLEINHVYRKLYIISICWIVLIINCIDRI